MSNLIKAGDTIYHSPTCEKLFVLGVNHSTSKLCIAGYPPAVLYLVNSFLYQVEPETVGQLINFKAAGFDGFINTTFEAVGTVHEE